MDTLIPAWVDGDLTPIDKLAAHVQGLKHQAVSVFVVRGDQILIQRRALGKYHTPGLWANTCCTHPLWQEPPLDCAHRRLQQELGIGGLDPQHRQQLEYRAEVGGGLTEHEVVDVYLAHAPQQLDIRPNPDEVMDTRWIAYRDLLTEVSDDPARFTPWLRIYLRDHAETILGADLASG
ncbi:isopentenyl-diphosphate Delta-isomerase [Sedimentitalea nanhaiensis]|uniref:Isopentenyl-diphosphate Delta-isomerase n=1 Tax=Sedimentitalea nanhaiensis TaxID=999627 RepID=A0A1I6XCE5_9RHOB|nr:isopentenyl-diphosphate Delta-isomerase [Sedimentitalea nanhaiensis]SFT35783.1 isopentenyl-diphosphate delta-isomerase [Sedimentitalea nanhaiensis]